MLPCGSLLERSRLRSNCVIVFGGERRDLSGSREPAFIPGIELDEGGGIDLCRRIQEHCIEQSEHTCIETNTERQCDYCNDGKQRLTAGRSNGVEKILPVNPHVCTPGNRGPQEFQTTLRLASMLQL